MDTQFLGHGENNLISKGYYFLKQDTLILFYEALKDPFPSYYEVIEKTDTVKREIGGSFKMTQSDLYVDLHIVDLKGNPVEGCMVLLRKGDAIIASQGTDKDGKVQIATGGKLAEGLAIIYFGYKRVWIDLKDFWGYQSIIKVVLSDLLDKYNEKVYMMKYIVHKTKGKIDYLKSIDPKSDFKLTKKILIQIH